MCGICGVLDLNGRRFPENNLRAMASVLRHRGPDDEGQLFSGPLAMAFRRLSIVDVGGGHQPMANEDGTIWIVFNGEIYNDPDLRPLLEQRGHCYATKSDTETILHLYEEYGEDCVHHLRGMFAFAIWDAQGKKLFCARDRLGIKPFYYTLIGDRFAFASEIKALLELPGLRPRLNRRALPEFFALGYLSSEETMFEGIYKLLPGHRLRLDLSQKDKEPRIAQYWDLDISSPDRQTKEADYVAQFSELFAEAVRTHLRSDVPLGVFLSGGLDSSSIAAVVASLRQEPIQTFSVGYREDQYSELSFARQVAAHIGAEHNEIMIGPEEFLASLPQMIWHEDEPVVWPSSVALGHVACLAGEKVKVVLTGEGADEILAGYLKYRVTLWNLRMGPAYRKLVPLPPRQAIQRALASRFLPAPLQRKLQHSFLYHPGAFEDVYFDNFYSVFSREQQSQLLSRSLREEVQEIDPYANSMQFFSFGTQSTNLLNRLLYLDIKTYLVELLMKQDQMSMAASIESRVPFLDHRLVEFTARVPARYKIRGFSGKYLLRRAMMGRLPAAILRRNKKGFPTPIRPWLQNQLFDTLRKTLTDGRLAERRLVNPEYVLNLLSALRQGSSQAAEGCWRLLNFELWCRIFLDRDAGQFNRPAPQSDLAVVCA
jgi:asparagine synthase (glutamine-hydrolysing)